MLEESKVKGKSKMGRLKKLVGLRIKEIRTKRGLTQEQLSVKTGIALSTICRLENGVNMPREENLEELSKVLDVGIDAFFKFEHYEGDRNSKIVKICDMLNKLNDNEITIVQKIIISLLA